MSSLTELPELVGFFSYSRDDDADFKGALSALRDGIYSELRARLGRSRKEFSLWQDKSAIALGTMWKSEIKKGIEQSFFFIPIITPSSIKSDYCKFEFELFLAREKALGRDDLIFPIIYIPVDALEDESKRRDDPVLSIVAERQRVDWHLLRHRGIDTTEVREKITAFCEDIVKALNAPWTSPEETPPNGRGQAAN